MTNIATAILAEQSTQRFIVDLELVVGLFIRGMDSNSLVGVLVYFMRMGLIIPCFKLGLHQRGFMILMVHLQMDSECLLHYLVADYSVVRHLVVSDLPADYSIGCSSSYAFFSRSTFF
jgi:hypothetical protein